MGARRVVVVAYDEVAALDVVGPLEVFDTADRLAGRGQQYDLTVAAVGQEVTTVSGLRLAAVPLGRIRGPIDTLVVAGGLGSRTAVGDQSLLRSIRRLSSGARRTASVCTGAFLLAECGLLDGRRATTHWASCDRLASAHRQITVEPDRIYVRDGAVWTSAGVTAGMDLALALVADDLGPSVARDVARWLVMFAQRPGGQAQFSTALALPVATRDSLRDLLAWLPAHLGEDLSVARLAARSGLSERTFARAFKAEVGVTPAAHVEALRVEAARHALESTDLTVAAVAARFGFGTAETLHRSFRRRTGTTPDQYRRHFRVA